MPSGGTAWSATLPTPPLPHPQRPPDRRDRRRGQPISCGHSWTTPDSRLLPAWIFLATSGCRRGECLGLRWDDLDLDTGTAVILRQVTALDHEVVVKDVPKTKHGHLIRLDTGTHAMLRRLRIDQAEHRPRMGPAYPDGGYVFCQWDGTPYHPERFSREFDRKRERSVSTTAARTTHLTPPMQSDAAERVASLILKC
jgi:integrase